MREPRRAWRRGRGFWSGGGGDLGLGDFLESGLDVVDRDGLGLGDGAGKQRVVGEEVDLTRQTLGRLRDRLDGRRLEERQVRAGEPEQMSEVLRELIACQGRAGDSGRRCAD